MPNYVLLTGAGFSRNWGGWLVDEAFEYLLSTHQIDGGGIRDLLWSYRERGGFEAALAVLQQQYIEGRNEVNDQNLTRLESALYQMFGAMNFGFRTISDSVRVFLNKFDAIFTLNQDLLLERQHYETDDGKFQFLAHPRWKGWRTPGMDKIPGAWVGGVQAWSPGHDLDGIADDPDRQPYFKLHGSSDWI